MDPQQSLPKPDFPEAGFPKTAREAVLLPQEQLMGLVPLTHVDPKVQAEIDIVLKVVPTAIVVARQSQNAQIALYGVPRQYGDERQMDDLGSVYDPRNRAELEQRRCQIEALAALERILKIDLEGTDACVERKQVGSGFRDGKYTDTLVISLNR